MPNATLFPPDRLLPVPHIAGLLPASVSANTTYTYHDDRLNRLSERKRAVLHSAADALLQTAIGVLNGEVGSGALFLATVAFQDALEGDSQIIMTDQPKSANKPAKPTIDLAAWNADFRARAERLAALHERRMRGGDHVF
jgi:hypothetical protein